MAPLAIINDVLLEGMKVVGDLFGKGEMQLPFVLQSAETMKAAVAYLEPHMEKADQGTTKGRIVLATVKGDVHDIGKNLVDIILTNNGYEVHNLGIKVGVTDMVDKAVEVKADAIGMSGLLVKSTLIMRENLEELNSRGLAEIPVLLGGAALTRVYVERDLREVYEGRLFYGKDAFEGLHVMDRLGATKRGDQEDDPDWGRVPVDSTIELRGRFVADADDAPPVDLPARSPDVATDNPVFTPPFLGSQVVKGIPIDDIAAFVNETALFRNQWQFRPEKGENDEDFKSRIRPQLREELAKAKAAGLLVPQVVYGYFPANGDGDDLVIWTDEARTEERARFHFPRQRKDKFLCIADFFRPAAGDEVDYAAFHIVTMGPAVSEATAKLFADDRYQEYLLLHGLGVEMAEALAELWHKRIRTEWGFVDEDGPALGGPVPPAVPRRPLLLRVPRVPGPRGQRHDPRAARRRPDRPRLLGGDGLPVPARADHQRAHLPPPRGQVLRGPLSSGGRSASCHPTLRRQVLRGPLSSGGRSASCHPTLRRQALRGEVAAQIWFARASPG